MIHTTLEFFVFIENCEQLLILRDVSKTVYQNIEEPIRYLFIFIIDSLTNSETPQ